MRRFVSISLLLSSLVVVSIGSAQQTSTTSVPNLIRCSGTLKETETVATSSATVGVTFAIYKQQEGGAPVWMETQNVTLGRDGQYSVLLGSTTATGVPGDLFSQQEERWLGVKVEGQAEQPRVLLVSVPYAFKAHEADTLGGLPVSAFLRAPTTGQSSGTNNGTSSIESLGTKPGYLNGRGLTNYVPVWLNPYILGSSAIYQTGGNVGVGTTTPKATLDVNGSINSAATYGIGGSSVLSIGSPADSNLFLGVGSGASNIAGQGFQNAFSGYGAGFSNTTGWSNTFGGYQAGLSNTTGSLNTFSGAAAGLHNTSGGGNTFYGAEAGFSNTSGGTNTFFGEEAGYSNTSGTNNTFSGHTAGHANTTGGANTFYGTEAGPSNTTGRSNTFHGFDAGFHNTTGNNNAFYGVEAGNNNVSGNNNIDIGNPGCPYPCAENSTIRIGGDTGYGPQTATYIAGIYGSTGTLTPPTQVVCVDSVGLLYGVGDSGCASSSRRFKEQIIDMGDSSSRLFQLRPVTFFYKPQYDNGSHLLQYGLIAEEVAEIYPDMVAYDREGEPYTVKYQYLAPMLLNELQKQHAVVATQQDMIKTQQEQIQSLQKQNEEFQQRLSRLESLIAQPAQVRGQN